MQLILCGNITKLILVKLDKGILEKSTVWNKDFEQVLQIVRVIFNTYENIFAFQLALYQIELKINTK